MSQDATIPLTRQYGRLLVMMRRLVKEEFGVTIHLEEKGATEELLAFASRSRQHLLRDMMREMEELRGETGTQATEADTVDSQESITYYRGAPVLREKTGQEPGSTKPSHKKRIYRGREVT